MFALRVYVCACRRYAAELAAEGRWAESETCERVCTARFSGADACPAVSELQARSALFRGQWAACADAQDPVVAAECTTLSQASDALWTSLLTEVRLRFRGPRGLFRVG